MAAEEPTVTPNEDGTYTYTFKLREDAKWSDGQPVTANDFVYSWRRLVDPATASPYNTYRHGKEQPRDHRRRAAQGGAGRRRSRRAHL